MADNVPITGGAGYEVATDNVGDVHYQVVKLDVGGDGVSDPVVGELRVREADGDNAALGATTDAAVSTDTTGTISGKLRGLVALMVNFLSRLPAALGGAGGLKVEGVAGGVVVPTKDSWAPVVVADVTDNDSDKTLTVPASTEWQLLALYVTLTTTADVGDRQLAVLFTDGSDNVLAEVRPQVVQAASLARKYSFALGNPDDLEFYDTDLLRVPLPLMTLPAGYKIRIYDNNAVAAAADDMHVQLTVLAR